MKYLLPRQCLLAFAVALACWIPVTSRAGGNSGQVIARFHSPKETESLSRVKPGSYVVKVCRACNQAVLVRVVKGGKGLYDYEVRKCDGCGSDDTFVGVSGEVSFKERSKR